MSALLQILLMVAKGAAILTVIGLAVIGGGIVILAVAMERMDRVEIEGPRPR